MAWITVVLFYLSVLVYLGLTYLPSNGDSLVYHLVRVEHWIQDRSVAAFPTHYLAQIELSPLSEYNMLHFQLLSGSDYFDGFVQLLGVIVCLVAVSEISRIFGANRHLQIAAVVVCVTVPALVLAGHEY